VRDTTYTVTLTDGITDLADNPLVPFSSTFTTEAENNAPVVSVTGPTSAGAGDSSTQLVFNATVTDDNDDDATLLAALVWYIDGLPAGVTGPTMNTFGPQLGAFHNNNHNDSDLVPAVGPHTVEARSLDNGGLTGSGALVITIID